MIKIIGNVIVKHNICGECQYWLNKSLSHPYNKIHNTENDDFKICEVGSIMTAKSICCAVFKKG